MMSAKEHGVAVHLWAVQAADGDYNQSEDLVAEADERRVLDRGWITRAVRAKELRGVCAPAARARAPRSPRSSPRRCPSPRHARRRASRPPPRRRARPSAARPPQHAGDAAAAPAPAGTQGRAHPQGPRRPPPGRRGPPRRAAPAPSATLRWSSDKGWVDRPGAAAEPPRPPPCPRSPSSPPPSSAGPTARRTSPRSAATPSRSARSSPAAGWSGSPTPCHLQQLSGEYPRIPHRIDGELLRYAARFGLLAHKDDQIDEHDRYAIRAGFWREIDVRTAAEHAPAGGLSAGRPRRPGDPVERGRPRDPVPSYAREYGRGTGTPARRGEVVCAVRGLIKTYPAVRGAARRVPRRPQVRATDDVTLDVRRGEIFGLLGPNGAGKTTLVRQLTGLLRPDSGSVEVLGHDIVRHPERAARLLAYLGQESTALDELTVSLAAETTARLRGLDARAARARAGRRARRAGPRRRSPGGR